MSAARGFASRAGLAAGKSLGAVDAFLDSLKRGRQTSPSTVNPHGGGRTITSEVAKWLGLAYGGGLTSVSESRALAISYVWACLKVKSEDVARHSIRVVREVGPELYEPVKHPLNQVLNWRPNPEMSSYSFFEAMTWNYLLRRDAFAERESSMMQRVKHLWIMPTMEVDIRRDGLSGQLLYDHYGEFRTVQGMTRERVLHVHNLSADGLVGMDWRAVHASTTLAKPVTMTDFLTTFFRNMCRPVVVLKYPEKVELNPEQKQQAREAYMQAHSGENYGRPAVADRGVSIETHALDLNASQVEQLLSRSPAEICSLFRVPPHKVGDLSRSTNNNIEAQDTAYDVESLGPERARWEGELSMLVDGEEIGGAPLRVILDEWELTRGAMRLRYETHKMGIDGGFVVPNESRAKEGMSPIDLPIMNEPTLPVNKVPASLMYEVVKARAVKDGGRDPASPEGESGAGGPAARGGAVGGARSHDRRELVRAMVRRFGPAVAAGFVRTLKAERAKLEAARDKGDFARRANEIVAGGGEAARGVIEPIAETVQGVLQELSHREGGDGLSSLAQDGLGRAVVRMSELYRIASQSHAIEQRQASWSDERIAEEAKRRAGQVLDELAVAVTDSSNE